MPLNKPVTTPMPRRLLAYLAPLLLLLGALGVQVYRSQLQMAQTREQDQLLSVARLKVEQIAAWRRDRLADAEVLSANPVLMTGFRDWLNRTASPTVQADLMAVIEALRRHYGYRDYLLADATGRVRVASGQPSLATLEAHAQAALATVQRSRAPYLTELHTDSDYPYPHLGLVVPLWQGDAPAGALILLVDAQKTLYPLLQTWPVPSATAETLLVRREGDAALFLNKLRHQPDTALRLRLPLTRADLPSTQAILGARGVVEGRDYRGVPVLAAVFPVPDTSWFVVTKVDRLELYAGVRREAVLLGGGLLTLLALAGAVLGLVWQRTLQAARAEFSRRQQLILTEATDGLWDWNLLTGEDFHSSRYRELLGYGPGELPDTADGFEAIVHPDDLPRVNAAQQAHLERRVPYQVELRLRTKQGDYRWFVSRGQAEWDADGRPLRMAGFITDITERKATEEALRRSEARLDFALTQSHTGAWTMNLNDYTALQTLEHDRLFGYEVRQTDWNYDRFRAHVLPEDWDALDAHLKATVRQGGTLVLECRIRRVDGAIRWVRIVGDYQPPLAGEAPRYAGIIQDITDAKALEASLRAELALREQLRQTSEHLPGVIYTFRLDADGRMTMPYASAKLQDLYGCSPEAVAEDAEPLFAPIHPDDIGRIRASIETAARDLTVWRETWRIRHPVRGEVWIEGASSPRPAADGSIYWHGFLNDITERKALDAALQEAGQRYINLLRATKDAFWLIEAGSGRLLDVNAAAVSLSGYTREELLALRVTDLDIDFQGTNFAAEVQQIRGAGWGLFESRHRRKDGQVIPVEISVIPEVGGHKILAFIRDISERKALEAALVDLNAHLEQKVAERTAELAQRTADLARTSERLDLAMQVTSDGVWDCDFQSEKVYCNANYFAMLGYGPDELGDGLDAVFTDLLPPEEREAIVESISQRFAAEGGHESEFRMRAKDGSYRWVYARGRLVERDAAGQPLRAIGTHVDITARKKAEEALQDLNATLEQRVAERTTQLAEAKAAAEAAARAKSEFLANMSHEIRTPMNAILGLTQILEREHLTPDQRDMLQKIGDSGAGLLHIINDILDFSKIEAGQLKVERCAFELSPVLNQLEALLTGSAAGKGLELRIEPPVGLAGPVIGDPLRIKQILLNLVSNAIKFTEQGTVTVGIRPLELTETAVRLRFEVSDTGLGIAPAALAKLFQPFTQADASTTRRFGGTGLGLSICKRLVELMGGTIGATSELGAGSTFWFELPFERTATVAAPAGPRLQGLRVLAVDDNRINLFMLERALKLEGVGRVQLAADGQQALQTLEADPQGFDCVLMDVQMPVMDGLTATRLIRGHAELRTLPVIALTAGVMAEERERAEAAGVTGFLAKPLELAAMVTMLRPYAPEPAFDPSPP